MEVVHYIHRRTVTNIKTAIVSHFYLPFFSNRVLCEHKSRHYQKLNKDFGDRNYNALKIEKKNNRVAT